jgi:ligand-binding SRPBCC domain-containing protein
MKHFYHEFEVDCDIDKVWKFYTNIGHLKVISPDEIKLNLVHCSDEILRKDTVACFSGKLIINANWCSRITFFEKYEYVDEMVRNENREPPFKIWKHRHTFKELNYRKTRVIDQIQFELPYGFLGKVLESFVLFKISNIFKHRKLMTIEYLGS